MSQGHIHPRTGEPLYPIVLCDGRTIWPLLGAEPDGKDDDDDSDDDDDDDSTDRENDDDTGGAGDDDSEGTSKSKQDKKLTEENARRRIENRELQKKLDDATAQLRKIEDKDKSELELAKRDAEEATGKVQALQEELEKARISNAFLTSNKYTWHNPARALSLVDRSNITIDEDGNVTGLDKALDALAKSDSYLLKNSDDEDEGTPSGGNPRSRRNVKDADRARLEKRYPALRR